MIDPQVFQLLERAIDTPAKLQILLIFYECPRMAMTSSQMVDRSCRDIWSVTQALHELVEDGILAAHGEGADTLYLYQPVAEHLDNIARLVRSYDDPLERDMVQRAIRDLAVFSAYRRASSWERQRVAV